MFNFLKKQHVEFYVLIVVPLAWITALIILNPAFLDNLKTATLQSVGFYAFFGGPFYELAFLLFYNYLIIKACLFLKDWWLTRQNFSKENLGWQARIKINSENFYWHLKCWVFVFLPISITSLANGLAIWDLSQVAPEKVAQASLIINEWDYQIFGVYLVFWLQKFNGWLMDFVLINAYQGLTIVFPIIFFSLLMFKKNLFRQFTLAALMAPMIAYPFWRAWPAISPSGIFRHNITKSVIPADIKNEIAAFSLTEKQKVFDQSLEDFWIDKTGRTFAITSFPSMHAAWGIISTYFGILLWRPLAIILIPWVILNSFGAIYVLQHYGVDMPAGTIVGILAIIIAGFLLRLEKKYLSPSPQVFLMIDVFQKDCRNLIGIIKKAFRNIFTGIRAKLLN